MIAEFADTNMHHLASMSLLLNTLRFEMKPVGCPNIKVASYQYRDFYYKDKTVSWLFSLK